MWIAVAAAACVAGCAQGSTGLTGPSPLAVATSSVPSSCAVPGTPENLSADVIGDASDYVVLVGWTPTSSETVFTNASETHHSIDDLPRGTHFARVHAHNWCGTSAPSEPIKFAVD
jgi:hypothetical protein